MVVAATAVATVEAMAVEMAAVVAAALVADPAFFKSLQEPADAGSFFGAHAPAG